MEKRSVCGVTTTPPQESTRLCCAWDTGHAASAVSKLGYSEASQNPKFSHTNVPQSSPIQSLLFFSSCC